MALSAAEKQRAYRERQKLLKEPRETAQLVSEMMVSRYERDPVAEAGRAERAAAHAEWLAARPSEVVESVDEQEVRDAFGYSGSETRSKAERDAVAERILANVRGKYGSD
jgi:hypothetical protein